MKMKLLNPQLQLKFDIILKQIWVDLILIAAFNLCDVIQLQAKQVTMNARKYDYAIQKRWNQEKYVSQPVQNSWIAQIPFWNYILFSCIQIGLLIVWHIAQQCC